MEVNNGITTEMIDRELTYANIITKLLYNTNRCNYSRARRSSNSYDAVSAMALRLEKETLYQALEDTKKAYEQSFCWKLTKPLRLAGDIVRLLKKN